MKTIRKAAKRRKPVRRTAALSLSARVERLERELLFAPNAAKPTPAVRFVNLDAAGKPSSGEYVAVYDHKTGLTWSAEPLQGGKNLDHAAAMKACESLSLLGQKDWRAPTIEELLSIVDYTRFDPAVDTAHFKGPFGWTWSSTVAASPSGFAWLVDLDDGGSGRGHQSNHSRVRAVRAGQQLGLSV